MTNELKHLQEYIVLLKRIDQAIDALDKHDRNGGYGDMAQNFETIERERVTKDLFRIVENDIAKIKNTPKKMGRSKRLFSRREVIKANFLYYTNQRTITDVAKIMGVSPPVVERYLFKTKNEYETVSDKWSALDENEKVESL